jgi:DNA-binding XRE family transcriptional regulator
MTPAKIIRGLRKKAKMSMAELAEACGISRQAIHLIEAEKREPGIITARKIVKAFGVSLAVFD